jgi:proline dehydrogenase
MLYGIREPEQLRLASAGNRVRVYVPFGTQWYGYFMRRLAERPANLTFFMRALAEPRRSQARRSRAQRAVTTTEVTERRGGCSQDGRATITGLWTA